MAPPVTLATLPPASGATNARLSVAPGDEGNQARISWIQLFEKSSPVDRRRVAFSSSHKHLLLLVTSFLIKKEKDFFSSLFEERQKLCPSGRPRGGVSISTSKCCSDLLLLSLLFLQGPAQADTAWDHTVLPKDNSVGLGRNGQQSRRQGGRHCCAWLGTSVHEKHC